MPVFTRQPDSGNAAVGDTVTFQAQVEGEGPWSLQWYRNGLLVDGATQSNLTVKIRGFEDLGRYQLHAFPFGKEAFVESVRSEFAYLHSTDPIPNRGLRWDVFHDPSGTTITDMVNSEKYPNQPDTGEVLDRLEIPRDTGDNYGGRLTGYLSVPQTGNYHFHLCSDDHSEFYLSDDESPENEKLIAQVTGYARYRVWSSLAEENISAPIYLERGKWYSLRVVFRENDSVDHLLVAWHMAGQSPPRDGDPPIPGLFLRHRLD